MADNDVQMVFIRRAGSVFQYSVENEKLKEERAVQSYKNLIPGNAGKTCWGRFIDLSSESDDETSNDESSDDETTSDNESSDNESSDNESSEDESIDNGEDDDWEIEYYSDLCLCGSICDTDDMDICSEDLFQDH